MVHDELAADVVARAISAQNAFLPAPFVLYVPQGLAYLGGQLLD